MGRKSLETIYIAFIRPLLEEYGDVIWNNWPNMKKTNWTKYKMRTRATKLVSLDALYKETQWDTLGKKRENHKLTLFYKMMLYFYSSLFITFLDIIYETLTIYKQ